MNDFNKTVLIAGKDFPDSAQFAEGLRKMERTVIFTGPKSESDLDLGNSFITWNKGSPVSARNLVFKVSHECRGDFETVMVFDEALIGAKFESVDIQTCTQVANECILSFQYLTVELMNYFENHKGTLAFVYIPYSKNAKNPNPIVKAAGEAFVGFAQSIAPKIILNENLRLVLVKGDKDLPEFEGDSELATWLAGYVDEMENVKKRPNQKINWIKPGMKPGSLFKLFN